jgi:hypothetical protein
MLLFSVSCCILFIFALFGVKCVFGKEIFGKANSENVLFDFDTSFCLTCPEIVVYLATTVPYSILSLNYENAN